jgi:hypothetical protein
MAKLTWDQVGERTYETGVDEGVLYIPDETGVYNTGVAWNGLTTVTEKPQGAAATPQYADNIKYLNLISAETFEATIQAYTYPEEFAQCDGSAEPQPGIAIGQQGRKVFGLAYRTRKGNDIDGTDHGYVLHLVYGAQAAPSEKAYGTINDSPAAIEFSWDVTTTPVPVTDLKPTALLTVDSTIVDSTQLTNLEDILFGTDSVEPRLPLPDEIVTLFSGEDTIIRMTGANAPTYNAGTHIVTLPEVTGMSWWVNGENVSAGAQPAMSAGESSNIEARPNGGFVITGDNEWTYDY